MDRYMEYLNSSLNEDKAEARTVRRRLEEIKRLQRQLADIVESNSRQMNGHLESLNRHLEDGLGNAALAADAVERNRRRMEQDLYSDRDMQNVQEALQREVNQLERKTDSLEQSMNRTQQRISEERSRKR